MPGSVFCRALFIAGVCAFALAGFSGAAYAQPRVEKYLELKARQQWKEALAVARQEVASPSSRSFEYDIKVRTIALGALGDYASAYGLQPGMDDEARRYFAEGINGTKDERLAANLRNVYGRYFTQTKRSGRALPLYRENVEVWRKLDQRFLVVQALDALASLTGDMGEIALSDHYRGLALDAAADYFAPGRNNPTQHQWVQYATFLERAMSASSVRTRPPAELDRIWELRESVNRFVTPGWSMYTRGAQYYAAAGALDRAEQQLAKARESRASEASLSMATSVVHLYAGRPGEALAALEREQRMRTQTGMRNDDLALPRLLGLAYERTGALEKAADSFKAAIRLTERLRDSYDVAERAAFFRTSLKGPYHGLIRVAARQASEQGIERFWEAVQASEMVRARQLGDLIDPNAGPLIARGRLQALRAGLGPNRAVLYFTIADDDLVILALTAEHHVALVRPLDRAFAETVRRVASDLSRPQSPIQRVEQGLSALGATLLRPVADIVASHPELIVLPDGVINLLPFDLLSFDANGYRPLVDTHRVRLAPSLRFTGRTREQGRSKGVFVLADPAYKPPAAIAGVPAADLAAATRASSHLTYFQPLPETRSEAAAVGRMFGTARVEILLGDGATESALKRANLRDFSHLHFATHGILGEEVPGIGEPALVLAHEEGEDGFLTASEIARLKLDADLAVLSACNTGSGEYVSGEGVMGLSRAFLIAGSRSVVVSLWPVASQATERLMGLFYAELASGRDPHDALRAAKLKFRDDARKAGAIERHPMFWAPFVVFGT